MHTELLKKDVLTDLYEIYPERFSNKTNGITPRRWLALSNPGLTKLITSKIGEDWVADLDRLRQLEQQVDESGFREQWRDTQHGVKKDLVDFIYAFNHHLSFATVRNLAGRFVQADLLSSMAAANGAGEKE